METALHEAAVGGRDQLVAGWRTRCHTVGILIPTVSELQPQSSISPWRIPKGAPCGSWISVKRPPPGTSIGPRNGVPPACAAACDVASTPSTTKYGNQFEGTPGGGTVIPPWLRSPLKITQY